MRRLICTLAAMSLLVALPAVALAADPTPEPTLREVQIRTDDPLELGALVVPTPVLLTSSGDSGGFIRVDNVSQLPELFQIEVFDYTPDVYGQVALDAERNPTLSDPNFAFRAGDWYTFEASEFVLPPGTSRDVAFELNVPADAAPGDHVAALVVTVQVDPDFDLPETTGTSVRSVIKYQNRLQHRVSGAQPGEPLLTAEAVPAGDRISLSAKITNTGNTVLDYTVFDPETQDRAEINVTDASGAVLASFPMSDNTFYVMPEAERIVVADWSENLPLFGTFTATAVIPARGDLPAITATATFDYVNWSSILLIAGIVAGVLALIALVLFARSVSGRRLIGRIRRPKG